MSRFQVPDSFQGLPDFKHQPLDLASNEIRLIRVLDTNEVDAHDVRCEIRHDKLTPDLRFWTLSYTWGSSDRPWKILVNGAIYHTGDNLFKFLEAAQLDPEIREQWIWVDQVCIDQENVRERNHQVARMADIYRMSSRTLLWLDPDVVALGDWFHPRLIMNKYWSRLWIIQEVLLAKELQLIFNDRKLWWQDVEFLGKPAAACNFPREIDQYWETMMGSSNWQSHIAMLIQGRRNRVEAAVEIKSWREAIELSKQSGCADARDRIFGLLGLVTETIRIAPDYAKNASQIMLDVMLAELTAEQWIPIPDLSEFNQSLAQILGLSTGLPEEVLLTAFGLSRHRRPGLTSNKRNKVVREVRSDIRDDMEERRRQYKGPSESFLAGFLEKWVMYRAIYLGLGCPYQFWFDTMRILNDLARYKAHERLEIPGWALVTRHNRRPCFSKKLILVPFFSIGIILNLIFEYWKAEKKVKQDMEEQWQNNTEVMQIMANRLLEI